MMPGLREPTEGEFRTPYTFGSLLLLSIFILFLLLQPLWKEGYPQLEVVQYASFFVGVLLQLIGQWKKENKRNFILGLLVFTGGAVLLFVNYSNVLS
ncbi:hypothetical protein [Bacillus taeanensis]|uniref:Uncharacterized protein n=1 Tax=Bacillus taeanensis TaxID=273032 RepID=A0A366XU44_9BACI|nr:hypothetical protein [Bacillus taeanensis]RBW69078.1 hypothetical protein DS031_13040 [Bacillus taeanensis]